MRDEQPSGQESYDKARGQRRTSNGKDKEPQPLPFHCHGEKEPLDDRAWAVDGLIPEVGTGVLAGQWATFKTFVAFDLAQCMMTARPFINQFDIV
jgi:hypothetical protein